MEENKKQESEPEIPDDFRILSRQLAIRSAGFSSRANPETESRRMWTNGVVLALTSISSSRLNGVSAGIQARTGWRIWSSYSRKMGNIDFRSEDENPSGEVSAIRWKKLSLSAVGEEIEDYRVMVRQMLSFPDIMDDERLLIPGSGYPAACKPVELE